jgi:hypothetical protein
MRQPRIVLWDIETTHNIMAVFNLLNHDMIPAGNILKERYIVSAAWKELNNPKVHAVSVLDDLARFRKDPSDDRHVCEALHRVLSDADVIVAHNGNNYDIKFTETRMLIHDLEPLPPIPKIDTLKIAKGRFLFNANNLNYLGEVLGLGKKVTTPKDLWLNVLRGDEKAIRTMVKYNKGDVLLLEKVFHKLRPYCDHHLNMGLVGDGKGCPRCGSLKVQFRLHHNAKTRSYDRYYCLSCKGWHRTNVIHKRVTRQPI